MENGFNANGGAVMVGDNAGFILKQCIGKSLSSKCPTPKPRLLCLHGVRSNPAITASQLGNLGIDNAFEVDHLPGRLKTGTVFSWFETGAPEEEIFEACNYILSYVDENGPYEAVYGFSQGAYLVTLLSSSRFRAQIGTESRMVPWSFCILACAAVSSSELQLSVDYDVPSFHLVGTIDPFKPESDAIVEYFHAATSLVVYREIGHEVPQGSNVSFEILQWYQQHVDASPQDMLDPTSTSTLPVDLVSITNVVNTFVEELEAFQMAPQTRSMSQGQNFIAGPHRSRASMLLQGKSSSFIERVSNSFIPRRNSTSFTPRRNSNSFAPRRNSNSFAPKRNSNPFAPKRNSNSFAPRRNSLFALHKLTQSRSGSSLLSSFPVQDLQVEATVQLALKNYANSQHETLLDMLEDAQPDSVALYAPGAAPLTYAKLLGFMSADGDLRLLGLKQDSVVAYLAPINLAVAFLTIASQCTAAPLDPSLSKADVGLALEQIKPNILIIFQGVNADAGLAAADAAGIEVVHAEVIPETCGLFRFLIKHQSEIYGEKLVNPAGNNGLILRTSGTTSKPKVVPLKMSSIVANAKAIALDLGLTSSDIALNAMPLFHIGGLSANLLSSLVVGASVILLPRFNVADFVDHIFAKELRPTWYSAVPTMHAAIQHVISSEELSKHSLRFIRTGADAMSLDLAMHLEATLGCPVVLTYSMTEQMPISQPPTGYRITEKKPGSVGRPVTTSVCVVDEQMLPIPYRDSQGEILTGEICISGPTIMEEYMNNAVANSDSFFRIGGKVWFRTGDVGHIDKDGFLFLTSRRKELIKRGGEQISPVEVEEACVRFPPVKLCVCFAIKDPIWGERVGAAIILGDVTPEWHEVPFLFAELREFLHQQGLADYKLPEEIHIVTIEQLKKTSSGKYVRIGLAEHLGLIPKEGRRPMSHHDGASGVRFMLALGVMYVHIGRLDYLRDGWSNSRTWCIHTPLFFFIGGFVLSSGTKTMVTKRRDLIEFYRFRVSTEKHCFEAFLSYFRCH
jgi:acyl-CoA synthetase (AMP-forming)/AMP-acid ligase II